MIKDNDGPTVWSDGPQFKYDPVDEIVQQKNVLFMTNLILVFYGHKFT